jgi:MFS family permease
MMCGAFGYRIPPPGWRPEGWTPPALKGSMVTSRNVHVSHAWRTPQFWLLWMVLCMNVSAGIGVIGIASPMIQEIFGGRLIGVPGSLNELTQTQKAQLATIGAGFAALLSLFNIGGRISWASLSDYIGRKRTYFLFFALGILLYSSAPVAGRTGHVALFVLIFCLILTMYGGGFATIPAYLADLFGTQYVGAIHGRLLTAWSTAGILGPQLVNNIREYQIAHGIPNAQAYNVTMYVLAGMLVIGFFCNLAVRPVDERYFMTTDDMAEPRGPPRPRAQSA